MKKAEGRPADAPGAADDPAPVRKPRGAEKAKPAPPPAVPAGGWHWTWGRPPGGWKGPPSKSPDAWGPYKGKTDDEIRYLKSRRGLAHQGRLSQWLSPKEWEAWDQWLEDYKAALARRHGGA